MPKRESFRPTRAERKRPTFFKMQATVHWGSSEAAAKDFVSLNCRLAFATHVAFKTRELAGDS